MRDDSEGALSVRPMHKRQATERLEEWNMPIYEYRCRACGTVTEHLTGIREEVEISCSRCGSPDLEKLISSSSYLMRDGTRSPGATCCGREERCDKPPCSGGGPCRRDLH